MPLLDMRTLVLLTMLANFVFAASLYVASRMAPEDESVRRWAWGAIASGIGNLLLTLRGSLPEAVTILVANLLFVWGSVNLYAGSRAFFGLPRGIRLDIVLPVVLLASFIPLTYVYPSLPARITLMSLLVAGVSLLHGRLMLVAGQGRLQQPARFTGWLLVFAGLIMLLRAAVTPFAALSPDFMFAEHWVKPSAFLAFIVVSMGLAAALPIMRIGRMQESLEARELRARAMLEALPDMMIRADASGRVLGFKSDPQGFAMIPDAALVGHPLQEVIPAAFAGAIEEHIRQTLACRALVSFEFRLPLPDAGHADYEVRMAPSGPTEVTVIVRDITERKRNEAELSAHRQHLEELVVARTGELQVAKEAAESANVAKSAFLANMSHEMRTPLHQIGALATLFRRDPLNPRQLERMALLDTAVQRMSDLVENVLELTALESNAVALKAAPVDIGLILDRVRSSLANDAKDKNLALHVEQAGVPDDLLGDSRHLQLALLNYAENALRFTKAGSVGLRVETLEVAPDSALLRFSVRDTGTGIAPEVLPRLFTLFEQGDNSPTRTSGGTGAGLFMTRRIARLMGGDAGCDSVPGEGSTFWFTARLARRPERSV